MAAGKGDILEPEEIGDGRRPTRTSYGNYREGLFGDALEHCDTKDGEDRFECRKQVKEFARGFESGRWHEAMDRMHNMVSYLDKPERQRFFEKNPGMLGILRDHARVEEGLNKFNHVDIDDVGD